MAHLINPSPSWQADAPIGRLNAACRSAAIAVAILSAALWLLPVCYALYAMLLLDVALPGRSGETVGGLAIMAGVLIVGHAVLLGWRRQILTHMAALCDRAIGEAGEVRSAAICWRCSA